MGVSVDARSGCSRTSASTPSSAQIPLLGVIFDAFWKTNKWNLKLALTADQASDDSTDEPESVLID